MCYKQIYASGALETEEFFSQPLGGHAKLQERGNIWATLFKTKNT